MKCRRPELILNYKCEKVRALNGQQRNHSYCKRRSQIYRDLHDGSKSIEEKSQLQVRIEQSVSKTNIAVRRKWGHA